MQAEHETIIANEKNSERRAFYQLAWHSHHGFTTACVGWP